MTKKEYKEYLKSNHWKEFKRDFFKRFDRVCQNCGGKEKIQLHHKTYLRLWCEEFTDVIALCRFCHAKAHNKLHREIKKKKKENKPWSRAIKKAKKALEKNSLRFRHSNDI